MADTHRSDRRASSRRPSAPGDHQHRRERDPSRRSRRRHEQAVRRHCAFHQPRERIFINPGEALNPAQAYIATALDGTGALRALAFYVSQQGGRSGARLYCLLFAFFFLCGAIFGNDPIILSGTAFLAYFTRVAGIAPPTAWIFMEFIAANVASAVLVSSNPTNVLLAQAFELNFLT